MAHLGKIRPSPSEKVKRVASTAKEQQPLAENLAQRHCFLWY